MPAVYELWLWIMQLILLRNPDFHHGLLVVYTEELTHLVDERKSRILERFRGTQWLELSDFCD